MNDKDKSRDIDKELKEKEKELELLKKRVGSLIVRLFNNYLEKNEGANYESFFDWAVGLGIDEDEIEDAIGSYVYNTEIEPTKRDKTRYFFGNDIYLKNKLVLVVVKKYVEDHPDCTIEELEKAFPKSIQGSIGVVVKKEIADERKDCAKRFFVKEKEIIHLKNGDMYVCSQWDKKNISNFVLLARKTHGYEIEEIYNLD